MQKITGIKSVDFKIIAKGHGVVNWNGSTDINGLVSSGVKKLKNHTMPKLRGYSNKRFKEDGGYSLKFADEIDFERNKLYISQNCIRHHLFKQDGFIDYQNKDIAKHMDKIICSLTGLLRGYVIPDQEYKRTSPLLITDFEDTLNNGNFEQMGRAGSKEKQKTKTGDEKSNSLFSKTTFGETLYESYGSISIEQLQFIPLEDSYGRKAYVADPKEGKILAEKLTAFLKSFDDSKNPQAVYNKKYVRKGSIFSGGESGLLLNDDAIDIVVNQMLSILSSLVIRQAKGFMYVDEVTVDYNDSEKTADMFRIIRDDNSSLNDKKTSNYAVYFEAISD